MKSADPFVCVWVMLNERMLGKHYCCLVMLSVPRELTSWALCGASLKQSRKLQGITKYHSHQHGYNNGDKQQKIFTVDQHLSDGQFQSCTVLLWSEWEQHCASSLIVKTWCNMNCIMKAVQEMYRHWYTDTTTFWVSQHIHTDTPGITGQYRTSQDSAGHIDCGVVNHTYHSLYKQSIFIFQQHGIDWIHGPHS